MTGQTQEDFVADLRRGAERSLRVRILLEAVAEREGIEVGDGDLGDAIADMAERAGRKPDELRGVLAETGQDRALAGDILRRRALERVLEASVALDPDGNPVDLTPEVGEEFDEDGLVGTDDLEEAVLEDAAGGDSTEETGDQGAGREDDEDS